MNLGKPRLLRRIIRSVTQPFNRARTTDINLCNIPEQQGTIGEQNNAIQNFLQPITNRISPYVKKDVLSNSTDQC